MKKLLFTALIFLVALSMQAQNWYAGGSVGINGTNAKGESSAYFLLAPEAGYWFTDNFAFGASVDMEFYKHYTGIRIAPYVRYAYWKYNNLSLFADAGFGINCADAKGWDIGVKPGIAYTFGDKITVLSHLGFVGYTKTNDRNIKGDKIHMAGFMFTNLLSFSMFYNF